MTQFSALDGYQVTSLTNRTRVPPRLRTVIQFKSGRRCALCFGENFDFSVKKGQIAHVDGNPDNNAEENLAYLCLDHHDDFDSVPRLTSAITTGELKLHRAALYRAVEAARAPLDATVKARLKTSSHASGSTRWSEVRRFIRNNTVRGQPFLSPILNHDQVHAAQLAKLIQITPYNEGRVTYHTGYEFAISRERRFRINQESGEVLQVPMTKTFELAPGEEALLETAESLVLPLWLLGLLSTANPYLESPLELRHGEYVRPGYRGTLMFKALNFGNAAITLYAGSPILRMQLHLVNEGMKYP